MPQLPRSEWYDVTRDMNWNMTYVDEAQVWPDDLSHRLDIPTESWWSWDEP
jgi:toluene monooxygenase system protein A